MNDDRGMCAVESAAKVLAAADGLNWDEQCAREADPGSDLCRTGTCVATYCEHHDPFEARSRYRSLAKAVIDAVAKALP